VIAAPSKPPAIPPAALHPCDPPQTLPDRVLAAGEATRLWGRDRAALRTCETRRAAAAAAFAPSPQEPR
jgi:hypothetical protein